MKLARLLVTVVDNEILADFLHDSGALSPGATSNLMLSTKARNTTFSPVRERADSFTTRPAPTNIQSDVVPVFDQNVGSRTERERKLRIGLQLRHSSPGGRDSRPPGTA
ncbi:hypothetical protein ACIRQF_07210 [Streptomyces sp. NPDC101191]|uniref:hypothetical protein n=1 Tax=Streptomyces sp. NPDC101191 TaxID=3366126 RepID=UPI0037FA5082